MNAPIVFLRRNNVKKSVQKKLHSYFHSGPGFELTDQQNVEFWQTCAYTTAATTLCIKLSNKY